MSPFGFSSHWPLNSTVEIIDQLVVEHNIDASRIYLIGVGVGGNACWDMGLKFSDKFAALVPIGSFYRITSSLARHLGKTPTWMFHGTGDQNVSILDNRMMYSELKAQNGLIKHTEFDNAGRFCWDRLAEVDGFLPWLFAQRNTRLRSDIKPQK